VLRSQPDSLEVSQNSCIPDAAGSIRVKKQPGSVNMAGVFNSLFNPLKLRETLSIGICGIYKLKTPASSEEGFHSARQRGDFQAARQTEVSFTQLKVAERDQSGSFESGVGIRTLIKTPRGPGLTSFIIRG
jgi:hypothetical protein